MISCRHGISINLLKKNLCKQFSFEKETIGKDNPFYFPGHLITTKILPQLSSVPPRYNPTSPTGVSFPKHLENIYFHKTKLLSFRPSSFHSHVHNRGHGYSNSLTLCRGCTLSPQDPNTYRVGIIPAYQHMPRQAPDRSFSPARHSPRHAAQSCISQHQSPRGCFPRSSNFPSQLDPLECHDHYEALFNGSSWVVPLPSIRNGKAPSSLHRHATVDRRPCSDCPLHLQDPN